MKSNGLVSIFVLSSVLISFGFSSPLKPHKENAIQKPLKTGPQSVITIGDKIRAADLKIIETKLDIMEERINKNLDSPPTKESSKEKSESKHVEKKTDEKKTDEDHKKQEDNKINEDAEENSKDEDLGEETETEIVTEVVTEIIEEEGTTIVYEEDDDDATTTQVPSARA